MFRNHINQKKTEVRQSSQFYQYGTTGLLIATILPRGLISFILLLASSAITVLPLVRINLWSNAANLRWSTYINYSLLLAVQYSDELWPRIIAMVVATVISNWTQNILFKRQEELIRKIIERETVVKIIKTVDVQSLQ